MKKTIWTIAAVVLAAALPARGQEAARQKGWVAANFRKPSAAELQKRLTPLQYEVTQHAGTERAFANEYADNKRPGIYVDIVSGEPLFASSEYTVPFWLPTYSRPPATDGCAHDEVASGKPNAHLSRSCGTCAAVRPASAAD